MMDAARHRLVAALFWEAHALPSHERARFLTQRCADDPALLAEVTSLLQADEQTGILDTTTPLSGIPALIDADDDVPPQVGPYRVTHCIGRGGMGVVFRAHDPRLGRDVALKLLPRGLLFDRTAQARLIKEARAASALDHPHICTIYDIGAAEDGRLYIAMAYYGQTTLAQRLSAGPLDPAAAADIAYQVARGLDAAHGAGIVHRDIKPANIGFDERGMVKILDFGVALLARDSERAVQSAGTPLYMAPEQFGGNTVDARTDVWALGVVLHEMLTGSNPFRAVDFPAVQRSILHAPPPDVRKLRRSIPPALARIVTRALQKDPDRRFGSAAEMADALRSVGARAAVTRRLRTAALVAVIALLVLGGGFLARTRTRSAAADAAALDQRVVAVLPFRVSGDASLAYLREGMVDLLSAKLTGEGGLRAADPRNVLAAWRQTTGADERDLPTAEARALARRLGVQHILLGDVVATPATLVINASVMDVRGEVVARATVEGPTDALSDLVDGAVAQLLTLSAGEERQRLSVLTSTSLPALRAYLDGQAAYRRGQHENALHHFERALELDTTFALAGIGVDLAAGWVGAAPGQRDRAIGIAWRNRERLSSRDRALLIALAGADYPRRVTARAQLTALEDALHLSPDRADLWYHLADQYFHFGRILLGEEALERAASGFRRAIQLDSTFAGAIQHLLMLEAARANRDAVRAISAMTAVHEDQSGARDYVRWRLAVAEEPRAPVTLDSMRIATLAWIALNAQDDGIAVDQGLRAVQLRAARPGTRTEMLERRLGLYGYALNRGRPSEAATIAEWLVDVQADPAFSDRLSILTALYGDASMSAAGRAAQRLSSRTAQDATATLDRCVLDLWRLARDETPAVRSRLPRASDPAAGGADDLRLETCQHVRAATQAALGGDSSAAAQHVERLDAFVRSGPVTTPVGDGHTEYAHIALARLHEARGDRTRALSALRARVYFLGWQPYLAGVVREEGRLAALEGDHAGAQRAFAHYLALRLDPEPSLLDEVQQVRAAQTRALSRSDRAPGAVPPRADPAP